MPVEVTRIKGRLRALFPKANLSNKRIDEISARLSKKLNDDSDDAAIDEVVNQANDFISFEDIAKSDDRIRTLEQANQNAKLDDGSGSDGKTPKDEDKKDEDPTNKLLQMMQELKSEVSDIKSNRVRESKTVEARKVFDKNETFKGLSERSKEHFFRQIDVNSDVSVDDQISDLQETYNDMVQSNANDGNYSGKPPQGQPSGEMSEEEMDNVIGSI